MNVGDLFQALSFGELSDMALSLDSSGDIDEIEKGRLVHHANQALTAIYTRFPHKKNYVKVELVEDINKYFIDPEFAVSNTDVSNLNIRYIKDTEADPMDPRIGKILSIVDEDAECYRDREVLINDQSADVSVKMIAYNGFFVKEPVAGNVYTIEVEILHPLLDATNINEDAPINLAPSLHEALTTRIAGKFYLSKGNEVSTILGRTFMAQYEAICLRAEEEDTLQQSTSDNHDKLREGGWE